MSGVKGDIRPRAVCPRCGRSTAVTFNKRTGEAYLRPHNNPLLAANPKGYRQCSLSGKLVERRALS